MKKITFLFLMTLLPLVTNAGVLIDKINYDLNSSTKQATVIGHDDYRRYYKAWIPQTVRYNGETYSVTAIGKGAFKHCDGLKEVAIDNNVTTIGEEAFYGCGLTSVTFPNSVTTIGDGAFYGCGLTSVTIGNSVTSIGNGAFGDCPDLTRVLLNSNAIVSDSNDYRIIEVFGPQVTEYILGEDVTRIGDYAFYGCLGMNSITIGNSVTSIGDRAFYGCSDLTSVTIGNSVTTIGEKPFGDCPNLTRVLLNSNAVASGFYISYIFGSQVKEYIFGEDVTSIGENAFAGYNYCLTSVTIPNSVTSIGQQAFWGCSGLTSVTIPNSVTTIGSGAFWYCSGLTSVTIPNSVTTIGYRAFSNCSGLTSVTIGNGVTSIGNGAFADCPNLTKVLLNSNAVASKAYSIYECLDAFFGSQVKEYILGEDVTRIGDYAFYGCSGLISVTIPNGVETIGKGAFYNCSSLDSVIALPEIPPYLEKNSFSDYSAQLIVPKGCKEAYQQAQGWSQFKNITEIIIGTNFLQNVESGLFITAANDWGTRASVDETGITIVIEGNEENGYTLDTRVYENDTYRYLNLTENDKIYCDKTACNWFFKEISDGIYGLTKDNQKYIAYDGSSSVLTLSDNANDPKAQWRIVTEEMRKAELSKATEAAPLNATFLLPDANFSRFNQQGNWQGNPKKDGENTNMNGEKYDTNFDVYQEITGVPNGIYVVKMQGFYCEGADDEVAEMHQNGTEHLYAQFYVNEESMPVMSIFEEAGKNGSVGKNIGLGYIPNSQAHASSYFDRGLYEHELKVAVENGTLRIGVRKQTAVQGDWTCFDNFRLIYYGTNDTLVGIEQIVSEQGTTNNAPKSIYDLSGRKLQNLQRGVNILRMNDGTTRKVLKK